MRVRKPTPGRVVFFRDYGNTDAEPLVAIVLETGKAEDDPLCVRLFVFETRTAVWALHESSSASPGWFWPEVKPDVFIDVPDAEVR